MCTTSQELLKKYVMEFTRSQFDSFDNWELLRNSGVDILGSIEILEEQLRNKQLSNQHSSIYEFNPYHLERPDSQDEINVEPPPSSYDNYNVSTALIEQRVSKDSTNSLDINSINEEFRSFLSKRAQSFVWNLKHTDFEDGMVNDIIEEVCRYIERNKYVTLLWLHDIYSSNQKDVDILSGLLRIVEMTVEEEDTNLMLTMVKAGLVDIHSKTQEAAIMVIERWRTHNCLDALETVNQFSSSWIQDYAELVKAELREELK